MKYISAPAFGIAALLAFAIMPATKATAASSFTGVQIPFLPIGLLIGVDSQGDVAYWNDAPGGFPTSYVWNGSTNTALPGASGFPSSAARSYGASQTIVGDSLFASFFVATKWVNGVATKLNLGALPGATTNSHAYAINASGTIAGISSNHFFTIAPDNAVTDHGVIVSPNLQITGINNSNQVIFKNTGDQNGEVWQNGQWTSLPDLVGTTINSAPYGINDNGLIVGAAYQPHQQSPQAVEWQNGLVTALNVPVGTVQSYAFAVSDSGEIVGDYMLPGSQPQACIWDPSGNFYDLNNLVTNDLGLLSGQVLNEATVLNDSGQIGVLVGSPGSYRGYLLTPTSVPEPASLAVLALAAAMFLTRRGNAKGRRVVGV